MATGAEVLSMLIPSGGWVIAGNDFKDIQFIEASPITEKEFKDGFAKYDAFKADEQSKQAFAKALLLEKLGITDEEAKLLLS